MTKNISSHFQFNLEGDLLNSSRCLPQVDLFSSNERKNTLFLHDALYLCHDSFCSSEAEIYLLAYLKIMKISQINFANKCCTFAHGYK